MEVINRALMTTGLEPAWLELEITEGVLMENLLQRGNSFLGGLVGNGIRLAIDDLYKFILDLTDGRNWPLAIRPMR